MQKKRSNFKRALLIQADTTQTLPIVQNLEENGWQVDIIISSKWTYGYGTKYASKKFIFKDYHDIDRYANFVLNLLKNYSYDIILPMADEGAPLMSKFSKELSKYTKFVIPSYDVFQEGYDKHKLMEHCVRLGIPHPKTVSVHDDILPLDKIKTLKFPVLIKPNFSSGARGITQVNSIEDLTSKFKYIYNQYGGCHIQELIPEGGKQIKIQLYINKDGNLIQFSVISKDRWYPNKGGSSCCNKSIEHPKIVEKCYKLLKEIKWIGYADFDTIEDPRSGELLVMELNPRVPACVKTAFEAGINWAEVISKEYLGEKHQHYEFKHEIILRHLGFEILWFLNASNKFKTEPNWFNFFGINIYYQDMNGWKDPMAFIRGSIGNILKQLSPSFRKSKSGMN